MYFGAQLADIVEGDTVVVFGAGPAGAHVRSLISSRPDDPITESGVLGERGRHPVASRLRPDRVEQKHAWMDPLLVLGPWLAVAGVVFVAGRGIVRGLARRS